MIKKSIKIIFFGSGPVAEKSLKFLANTFIVECVITKPSTQSIMQSVVPKTTVHSVNNKLELDELVSSNQFDSEIAILIDFGIIVSQSVISNFKYGIVNSHFSLLPEWRGADPINFSILSGQKITGVSLMILTTGMDEGPIIAQAEHQLSLNETSEELTNSLIDISNALLTDVIPEYLKGSIPAIPQNEAAQQLGRSTKPSYSRKLIKQDGYIDWTKPAETIEREIRAFQTWPKSRCTLNNIEIIITKAEVNSKSSTTPGDYIVEAKQLIVFCGKDSLSILKLKPAGKKEMPIQAFLAGYKL